MSGDEFPPIFNAQITFVQRTDHVSRHAAQADDQPEEDELIEGIAGGNKIEKY